MIVSNVDRLTEPQARAFLERLRWPEGAVCPHCGSPSAARLKGASTRPGVHKCNVCRRQFTVTVNSLLADSHIPLRQWVRAVRLACGSAQGVSPAELQHELRISRKTALRLAGRLHQVAATSSRQLSQPTATSEPPDSAGADGKQKHRFHTLANEWRRATSHLSSVADISIHPAYQRIIGMGPAVVPLILSELERETDDWFWALNAITGADPIPRKSWGKMDEMAQAWIRWGRRHGYL